MPPPSGQWVHESGECEVDLARRELRARGVPVAIGARAFRIVETLVQSAGRLVTKDELMQSVWPSTIVEEHTLHVHISAARKALGPYRAMLKTESGRGYRLIGGWAVRQQNERTVPDTRPAARAPPTRALMAPAQNNLPAPTSDLIGRDHVVRHIQDLVSAYRIVTLTGAGGIGKTRLALEIARRLLPAFGGDVWLVELASLSDASLVTAAIASALGLHIGGKDISPPALARAIGGRRLLLVVDNCEHVIDAAARTVETVTQLCPAASVLTTSRERMRIEGEYTYRVPPLEISARDAPSTGQDGILEASAIQLFIARMAAWQSDFQYHDDLSDIAAICRHLDGIPLAIEFAASRAATLGVKQVLSGLDDRFALLISGRRTALPKHRTLRATLDWSYDLLSADERILLQRLAIFSGSFSLDAVNAVTNVNAVSEAEIADALANLVAKSLVTSDFAGGEGYFRLLETIRVYAHSKLTENDEPQRFARLHAEYYRGLLQTMEHDWEKRATSGVHIDNIRAALEWCFGADGDLAVGIGLAAAAAPVFLAMSLLAECYRWSQQGIGALDDTTRGGTEEMHLQAILGASSMHLYGQSDGAQTALERGLAIAEARGDALHQVELISTLAMFHARWGNLKTALHYARLGQSVSATVTDAATIALVHSVLGRSLHFMGDHSGARAALEAARQFWSSLPGARHIYLGLNHQVWVGIGLARTLWLQGYPAQAVERMHETVRDAEGSDDPAKSIGFALFWAPEIFLWVGDFRNAEAHADRLILNGETHLRRHERAVGRGYKGVLAIGRGNARAGIEDLRDCVGQLRAMRYEMLNTGFKLSLVEGLIATGQYGEALALVDETIGLIEANGDLVYMSEALRVKGNVLLSMPRHRRHAAETCFIRALDWSRRQGARSLELRATVDLAALWAGQGQQERARAVLQPIFESFVEGLDTADLKAAERLLAALAT
jgi:predicted ATPase/DNA-binding winged helix-turn-helix (wHTH) protein